MGSHAGLDRLGYPGDTLMQLLWDKTNLSWTGFYLAPAPSQTRGTSWMAKRRFLKDMGWGFAPIYVGQQQEGPGSKILTAAQGKIDAADAASLARTAGFPGRSVIYLDNESGSTPNRHAKEYYAAWVQGIFDNGFYPGLYCSYIVSRALNDVDARSVTWVFNVRHTQRQFKEEIPTPDLGKSGYVASSMWQFAQNCSIKVKDEHNRSHILHPVDFSSSDSTDPSNFLDFVTGF